MKMRENYEHFEDLKIENIESLKSESVMNLHAMKEDLQERISVFCNQIKGSRFDSSEMKGSEYFCNEFFLNLNDDLSKISNLHEIKDHLEKVEIIQSEVFKNVQQKIESLASSAQKILEEKLILLVKYESIDTTFKILDSFKRNVKVEVCEVSNELNSIRDKIEKRIYESKKNSEAAFDNIVKFKEALVEMQIMKNNLSFASQDSYSAIESVLNKFKEEKGITEIAKLGTLLEKDNESEFSKCLLEDHKIFNSSQHKLLIIKTQKIANNVLDSKIKNLEENANEIPKGLLDLEIAFLKMSKDNHLILNYQESIENVIDYLKKKSLYTSEIETLLKKMHNLITKTHDWKKIVKEYVYEIIKEI